MKFMMNGALTIGTLDGANVEISEQVGRENIFLFGLTAPEVEQLYKYGNYSAGALYEGNPVIHRTLETLINGTLDSGLARQFSDLHHLLLYGENGALADQYLVLKDFPSYLDTQVRVRSTYRDQNRWREMAILNTAKSGFFSSDRTIEEYNDKFWHLKRTQFEK